MPDRLAQALRGLLPPEVAVASADPRIGATLLPGEALPGATPQRLREFAAGRGAARVCLMTLGLPPLAIPAGPDRAPIWPLGVFGSLTHTAEVCLAALGRGNASIGIDLEPERAVEPDLWSEIATEDERRWLDAQPQPSRAAMATLIFCAKEATYKMQYPLTRTLFGFDALQIRPEAAQGRFSAEFCRAIGPFAAGAKVQGRFAHVSGHVLTAIMAPTLRS